MVEQDTIRLLRECDAGIRMGVDSIDEVVDYVSSDVFRSYLTTCKSAHQKLKHEVEMLLDVFHDEGKKPDSIAASMSWLKTNMKMLMDASDENIADIMSDGCSMGVKSLSRYLNQYQAADEKSKDIAKRLIRLEDQLNQNIREFL